VFSQYDRAAEAPVPVSQWIVASCTPCDRSVTSSLEGQRIAAMRRRRSAIAPSGMSTRKGRISVSPDIRPTSLDWLTTDGPVGSDPTFQAQDQSPRQRNKLTYLIIADRTDTPHP
jgi:hypothetical protein